MPSLIYARSVHKLEQKSSKIFDNTLQLFHLLTLVRKLHPELTINNTFTEFFYYIQKVKKVKMFTLMHREHEKVINNYYILIN